MKFRNGLFSPIAVALMALLAVTGVLYAQLEGGERGVAPIDSASTYEVTGVDVDVTGKTADEARYEGWRQAQARGWKALWASTHQRPQSEAPDMSDSALSNIVAGIIIEDEEIGPTRYIAKLGILFDRARTSQLLGGPQGQVRHSAAMLVIPVMLTGSSFQSLESRTEWQKAWARFRTGNSSIDYIRPVGSGIDPLLLNVGQTRRPGRGWWRILLEQYGAADVLVPEVKLERFYPGGPVIGTFTVRHGPDDRILSRFALRVERSTLIPRLLDAGVSRIDAVYTRALQAGLLTPDPTLIPVETPTAQDVAAQIEDANALAESPVQTGPIPTGAITTFNVQVDTPTAASVGQAELSVSRIGGVTSAITTSLALGGTSVMRVTYSGDSAALQAALQSQGWSVQGSGTNLRISRP